ncbi:MAG: ABC transporter permease [Bacteroidaceae bacterium]|nr:ABC transporter permease [Bacteroidaceae bacterium]MBQ7967111.1 ABC transporter permease [Bacteroidaceae bacterium]MBR3984198.1 ABC transporter permease [Bacteroidaceae bacterium]MBR4042750.1 ABC transporter permease [Bacteroidaceae bacterium]
MGTIDISYISLLVGMLLLLIPIFYIWYYETKLLKAICIGAVRMVVQMLFIGVYLRYLFEWDNPVINSVWVFIMVYIASETALTRTRVKRSVLMMPLVIGFVVAGVLIGLYFLGIVLKLDNVFSAQYFIPIMGILLGNMLTVNVIAVGTFYSTLQREQNLYYFLLGNGASRSEALKPFVRQAIVKSFSPTIANMAVMGLVSLPGTMIGQILGGSSPHVAIKYQIMIVVITMSASMLSLMIAIQLSSKRAFDGYGRMKQVMKG